MITSNTNLKKGPGNGTRSIGLTIQLKIDCIVTCKTWDGRPILEYMICETIPNNKKKPKRSKLIIEKVCTYYYEDC